MRGIRHEGRVDSSDKWKQNEDGAKDIIVSFEALVGEMY